MCLSSNTKKNPFCGFSIPERREKILLGFTVFRLGRKVGWTCDRWLGCSQPNKRNNAWTHVFDFACDIFRATPILEQVDGRLHRYVMGILLEEGLEGWTSILYICAKF